MSQIKNLFRDYGGFALNVPEWQLPSSGVTVLCGPSGSGKTSVLRLLSGLEACPGLTWKMGDVDLAQLSASDRRIGMVFQSYELFPHMTAEENILFAAKARKVSPEEAQALLKRIVEGLRLSRVLKTKADRLSGGEKQRVALARALMGQPRWVFLDEPFSALDEELRAEARNLTKEIITQFKVPTLLITHDQRDLDALADRVFHIKEGQLTEV